MSYVYAIEINDDDVEQVQLEGLAHLKFDCLALTEDRITLRRIWAGEEKDFDPVLHDRNKVLKHKPAQAPCSTDKHRCPYLKSKKTEFTNTVRPTALRVETMEPSDRCGFLLRPYCRGGDFWDYAICIHRPAHNSVSLRP